MESRGGGGTGVARARARLTHTLTRSADRSISSRLRAGESLAMVLSGWRLPLRPWTGRNTHSPTHTHAHTHTHQNPPPAPDTSPPKIQIQTQNSSGPEPRSSSRTRRSRTSSRTGRWVRAQLQVPLHAARVGTSGPGRHASSSASEEERGRTELRPSVRA